MSVLLLLALFSDIQVIAKNLLELPSLKKLRDMNGINPAPYDQFWDNWKLITTRYRKDNGEQRFVYANETAFNAMKSGKLHFPDGAVFGKIAYKTREDPQFPNSLEPLNFTRLQLMVKDEAKFKKLDGWSYYIYVDGKVQTPGKDHEKNLACHACHTLVKKRDFVFSAPTFLSKVGIQYSQTGDVFKSQFKAEATNSLPPMEGSIIGLLQSKPRYIMLHKMRLFTGSLHEGIGPLSRYASQTGKAYAIIDPVSKKFLMAEKSSDLQPTCKGGKQGVKIYLSTISKGKPQVKTGLVCSGKNKWIGRNLIPESVLKTF